MSTHISAFFLYVQYFCHILRPVYIKSVILNRNDTWTSSGYITLANMKKSLIKLAGAAVILVGLLSCTKGKMQLITVDSDTWGEEIILNDTGLKISLTLFDTDDTKCDINIPAGTSATLNIGSQKRTLCLHDCKSVALKVEDGRQMSFEFGDEAFFSKYELEEKDIWYGDALVDKKWPVYTYRISTIL